MRESYFRGNIKWGSKHKGVCKNRIIGGANIRGGSKGGKRINIRLKESRGGGNTMGLGEYFGYLVAGECCEGVAGECCWGWRSRI